MMFAEHNEPTRSAYKPIESESFVPRHGQIVKFHKE